MRIKIVLLIIICFFLVAPGVYAESMMKLNERIERANNYLIEIMDMPDTAIPSSLLKKCQGVVIMRQYKVGFIFGVKGGNGVVLKKDIETGKWSAPSFVTSGEGSIGPQIGVQVVDAILLIMNENGIESLLKLKFKLGVDASIAVGPFGRDANAKIGLNTAFLVYARAKGLYAGLALEGGFITQDNSANEKFYGIEEVTVNKILNNKVAIPDEARVLIETLRKYCGENKIAYRVSSQE